MDKLEYVEKLLKMREWIDENYPKWYKPYEQEFIEKAHELGLNPYTIKAVKREFELRFNISQKEWNLLQVLLHFSALRQAGIKNKKTEDKIIDIEIKNINEQEKENIYKMIELMWNVIEEKEN